MAVLPDGSRFRIVTDLYLNITANEFQTETPGWLVVGFDTDISNYWLHCYARVVWNGRHLITSGCEWIGIQSKHLSGGWDWRKSQTVLVMTTHDLDGHLPKTIGPHSAQTHSLRWRALRLFSCFFTLKEQTTVSGQLSWFQFVTSNVRIWTWIPSPLN